MLLWGLVFKEESEVGGKNLDQIYKVEESKAVINFQEQ
jgi:hypothetical protein